MHMIPALSEGEALRFACLERAIESGLSTTDNIVAAATKFEAYVKGNQAEPKPVSIGEGLRIGG